MRSLKYFRYYAHRRKLQCLIIFIVIFTTVMLALYQLSVSSLDTANPTPKPSKCPEVSTLRRGQLFNLLSTTSKLLDKLNIAHFICYKSLWGAIQDSGPFPWDANAFLCAFNSHSSLYNEPTLLRTFRRAGLSLVYSSANAVYTVTDSSLDDSAPNVQVTVFEEDPRLGVGMFRRVGWKRRLLPPSCDAHPSLECFPASLARPPLPSRTFGPLVLPAPQEHIDLLKFHFPETWWKPVQPDC